jgi:ribose 5-phosphate isomerase B
MNLQPIGLASDHAGYETKQYIIALLEARGIPYKDFGCYNTEACDYADPAHALGYAIDNGELTRGIAVCGSGNGINMTLNKHQSVRSALCWSEEIAKLARQHNDANVLVLPGRFVDRPTGEAIAAAWLDTPFEGGRHERRIKKIPL